MKYVITALSTTLLLSLMLHIMEYENMYYIKQSDEISSRIIQNMSDRIMELELEAVN